MRGGQRANGCRVAPRESVPPPGSPLSLDRCHSALYPAPAPNAAGVTQDCSNPLLRGLGNIRYRPNPRGRALRLRAHRAQRRGLNRRLAERGKRPWSASSVAPAAGRWGPAPTAARSPAVALARACATGANARAAPARLVARAATRGPTGAVAPLVVAHRADAATRGPTGAREGIQARAGASAA